MLIREFTNSISKVLKFLVYSLLLYLFFINNSIYAQVEFGNSSRSTIVLTGNAVLFSSDKDFNHQIISKNIKLGNAEVKIKDSYQGELLVIAGKGKTEDLQKNTRQLAFSNKKKEKEIVDALKKKADDYESRKKSFDFHKLEVFPSSEEFIASSHINKDYIFPGTSNTSKDVIVYSRYFVKSLLSIVHKQKFVLYNSRSLNFCFSEIFSVRPPPYLG